MTEPTTTPPGAGDGSDDGGGPDPRVRGIDLQSEMERSYLDYAMSVIVGRALPDVRDGLKPVHRRVLYAMYDGGYRPDRGYNKCSRVVGDVMGQYHPHGDSAIYDTLVRLAQPWSLRYPLVDGQGNFGSPGNDPPAAMRYCVVGDTRVRTVDGTVRIADIVPNASPNSDTPIDVKVLDRNGNPVSASAFFHSGHQRTRRVRTSRGYTLTGSENHPILCLVDLGVPTLLWKMLDELVPGDIAVLSRVRAEDHSTAWGQMDSMGGLVDSEPATLVEAGAEQQSIPDAVWRMGSDDKATFLASLFAGDGGRSELHGEAVQVSYATRSATQAGDVQRMLLELGVVSTQVRDVSGEHTVVVSNRADVSAFVDRVGVLEAAGQAARQRSMLVAGTPSRSRCSDHVPFLADFLRREGAPSRADLDWLNRQLVDRVDWWQTHGVQIRAHLTAEAAAVAEPLVDGRYAYDTIVAVEDSGIAPVYSLRLDTDDHAFLTDGFISHNTECRLAPLAMEVVRDIDQDTVDFRPNYDGRAQEPSILPSRFPNLLVNGSAGIAVGMATNIPPHNVREVAAGVAWALDNPDAGRVELLEALMERITGPDFPTGALIVGNQGIHEAYRTGRGSITMRAVVEVEEDSKGRTSLVVTELPYQVNPDNLAVKIAELVNSGRLAGIADIRDDTSSRTGQRLVIILKRDAVPMVVRNNLFKHTQLQDTFGANMVALVDGVPRTLSLDAFVRHWVAHQIEVIRRRTEFRLRKRRERLHIVRALIKAIDVIDQVIAIIRGSASAAAASGALQEFLEIDEIQARAILDLQLRKLAALERQELIDEYETLVAEITDLEDILARDERKRSIVRDELGEIVERYGDERRTRIIPGEGGLSDSDLIPVEDVVVTLTRGGYVKRTRADLYRSQKRGGKGVRGAQLRGDDVVSHLIATSTHHTLMFFTDRGRVFRVKAYEAPEAARDGRGMHVANMLSLPADESVAQVLAIEDYEQMPYLVLTTRRGLVKKTRLTAYDTRLSGGIKAIALGEDDALIGAHLMTGDDELLLLSRRGMAIRFTADDAALRPMGRDTRGVLGMKFRHGDELLASTVVGADLDEDATFVFTVTDGGYAKRTPVSDYRTQNRAGLGLKAARLTEERGSLVGALAVGDGDEVLAIRATGAVTRSPVAGVRPTGRDTMGVTFVDVASDDAVVAIARVVDEDVDDDVDQDVATAETTSDVAEIGMTGDVGEDA